MRVECNDDPRECLQEAQDNYRSMKRGLFYFEGIFVNSAKSQLSTPAEMESNRSNAPYKTNASQYGVIL